MRVHTHARALLYPKRLILLVIAAAAAVRRRAGYIITIAIIVALVSLTLVRLAPAYAVVTLGRCLLLILAAEPRGSSPSAPFVGGIHSRCEPITTSPIMHQPTHYLQSHAQAFKTDYLSIPFETPLALDPLEYHRAHVQRGVRAGDDGGDASSIDGSVLVHLVDSLQCLLVCNATRRRPRRWSPHGVAWWSTSSFWPVAHPPLQRRTEASMAVVAASASAGRTEARRCMLKC